MRGIRFLVVLVLVMMSIGPVVCRAESAPPGGTETKSFFWELRQGDATVYLLGTYHAVKPDFTLHPDVLAAFDESDRLAVETNILDTEAVSNILLNAGYYPEGDSLSKHLTPESAAHLESVCSAYGVPMENFETVRPFMVLATFANVGVQMSGCTAPGADAMLLQRAQEQGKPIDELEDQGAILASFNDISDDEQNRYFIMTALHPDQALENATELYSAFLSGDDARMLAAISKDPTYQPGAEAYRERMLLSRNQNMALQIEEYLKTPGKTFVAVGTAHYLDVDGIIALLEKDGITATRL